MPPSFSGYLEIATVGYPTYLFYPIGAEFEGVVAEFNLINDEVAQQIVDYGGAMLGREADFTDLGAAYLRGFNCQNVPARGLRFGLAAPGQSSLAYLVNNAVDFARTETSADGNAVYLFVDPGINTLSVTLAETGVEVARQGMVVRPGHIPVIAVPPARRGL
ncbi:MAG TPA: hypothetical protein VFS43_41805 [Polyangiaceae bacterium]|nr:hypothetical protein [Polyangiaceae bacterium]